MSGRRWKHWCHNGCGKKVVYMGTSVLGYKYKCMSCGQIYEDKYELDWDNKKG